MLIDFGIIEFRALHQNKDINLFRDMRWCQYLDEYCWNWDLATCDYCMEYYEDEKKCY